MPLILRTIAGTDLKDCTSAYGYCGPVSNCDFKDLPEEMFVQFRCELQQFFKREKDHYCIFALAPDHFRGSGFLKLWYHPAC